MASSDSQQREHPKRAELPDVNINTGVQSINTERASEAGVMAFNPVNAMFLCANKVQKMQQQQQRKKERKKERKKN